MQKNKVFEYITQKKFYLSLLGCLAIITIALTITLRDRNDGHEEIANLNEEVPNESVVVNAISENLVDNNPVIIGDISVPELSIAQEEVLESAESIVVSENNIEEEIVEEAVEEEIAEEEAVEQVVPVIRVEQPNITFSKDNDIIMPVEGNLLLSYSEDVPVYFKTLEQYQINRALFIESAVGTEVKAVADGVVETIEFLYDKGNVVTVYHGNGFKSIYGQLSDDMNVAEGDIVSKGRIVGYVAEVTSHYLLEGNHLYFEFTENGISINPLELIK